MYLGAIDPFSIAAGVLSMVAKPGGAPSTQAQPSGGNISTTVATNVQTQVSPQISPVFIQQEKPEGSAVTAATAQSVPTTQSATAAPVTAPYGPSGPGTPMTGNIPGFDSSSGYLPTGTTLPLPQSAAPSVSPVALVAAGGILLFAVALKKGKKGTMKTGGARRRRKAR